MSIFYLNIVPTDDGEIQVIKHTLPKVSNGEGWVQKTGFKDSRSAEKWAKKQIGGKVRMGCIVDEVCPACRAYNAYAVQDTNYPDAPFVTKPAFLNDWETIYHITACSGFEWTCGKCGLSFTPIGSPLTHPAYTHAEE